MAGSKVNSTVCSLAFMKRAWGEFSQQQSEKEDKCWITWIEMDVYNSLTSTVYSSNKMKGHLSQE